MIKTATTTAGINSVDFGNNEKRYYWIKNIGDTTIHVSINETIAVDADDVAVLNSGDITMLENYGSKIYVLGEGKVEIYETETPNCPFKSAPTKGGGESITIDTALSNTSENPVQNKVIKAALDEKASKSLYGDSTIDVGRKPDTTVGNYSATAGYRTTASGNYSHAEGYMTTASGGHCSHAEGYMTTASGDFGSHAEGSNTTASNCSSHSGGHYNAQMTTGGTQSNTVGTAFVIGNGASKSALSNAFSVQFDGKVKAMSTITASVTADYAEFFEWLDGNPDNEDRVGYFVTLDGNKVRIANSEDDYILGVVSGEPFVLGNGDCDVWNGMFLHDEFRRTIFEPAPKMVDGEEVEGEFDGTRPKLNPEYDSTQKYVSRFERKEWAAVGMLGVLPVRHDGTAVVNEYVTVNSAGIATACEKTTENSYRVIKSNSDSVVEIIFR